LTYGIQWDNVANMKTWITYLAAVSMGYAANLLLGDLEIFKTIVGSVSPILLNLGMFLLFPLVFVLFSSGISSLRRQAETPLLFSSTILWSLVSTMVLSIFAAAVFFILPLGIDNVSAMGSDVASLSSIQAIQPSQLFSLLITKNAFFQFIMTDQVLLPLLFIAFLTGFALKPDMEIIRPAYVVMNSFSEAMLRLARVFTSIGALFLGFISSNWFLENNLEELFYVNLSLFALIGISLVAALLIIMPLLFALFTGFKGGNPYRVLFNSLGTYLAAFFTGNILFTTTSLFALNRQNNGVRKRIVGTAIPLYTIIGRGGSAMIATTTAIALIVSVTGNLPAWQVVFSIALLSSLFSLLCSFHLGYEVLFIVVMVLRGLDVELQGAEMTVVMLLPLLNGFGTLIDTAVATFGSTYTSRLVSPNDIVAYRDTL
jgi:Na+/H+-dicarboxylate symporter